MNKGVWEQLKGHYNRVGYIPTSELDKNLGAGWDLTRIKQKQMKKRPFQYMVLLHQYEKDDANLKGGPVYKDSIVIIDLKTVMAKSEKELVFKITREIPEEHAGEPDNVEIIIRPF